uniref:Uncharacterized protein n=1 Tax=Ditylenchus dipsaci TaxID=166011 RepID=A0A915CRM7_9BILA
MDKKAQQLPGQVPGAFGKKKNDVQTAEEEDNASFTKRKRTRKSLFSWLCQLFSLQLEHFWLEVVNTNARKEVSSSRVGILLPYASFCIADNCCKFSKHLPRDNVRPYIAIAFLFLCATICQVYYIVLLYLEAQAISTKSLFSLVLDSSGKKMTTVASIVESWPTSRFGGSMLPLGYSNEMVRHFG